MRFTIPTFILALDNHNRLRAMIVTTGMRNAGVYRWVGSYFASAEKRNMIASRDLPETSVLS